MTVDGITVAEGGNVTVGDKIISEGEVGVGTTSPYAKLSVVGQGVFETLHATGTGANIFDGHLSASSTASIAATTTIDEQLVVAGTNSTSTFAGGLAIETSGFVYDFSSGNVGIGTTTPDRTLSVDGSALVCGDGDGSCPQTTTDGDIYATSRSGGAIDIAEWIQVGDENLDESGAATIAAGELVCAGEREREKVLRCEQGEETRIVGVVSTKPHLTMGAEYEGLDAVRLALAGRVPVAVNLEGGVIAPGDRITLSATPGVGMKATSSTYTAGIALEPFSPSTSSGQAGSIMMLISLGYYTTSPATDATATLAAALATDEGTTLIRESVSKDGWFAATVREALVSFGITIEKNLARFDGILARKIEVENLGADTVTARRLCLDDVCVTKDDLRALLGDDSNAKTTDANAETSDLPAGRCPRRPMSKRPRPPQLPPALNREISFNHRLLICI